MRALCGAIIAAGALVGLGLTSLGLGIRYQSVLMAADRPYVRLREMDTPMIYLLVVLSIVLLIGLGIAILGLAYHHERRLWERHQGHGTRPPM